MGRVSQGRGEEGLIQEWMKVRYFSENLMVENKN